MFLTNILKKFTRKNSLNLLNIFCGPILCSIGGQE
jgi:hypothetical protein